jgi:hypothetical protein
MEANVAGSVQDFGTQGDPCETHRVAADNRLARGTGLAGIPGQAGIAGNQVDAVRRYPRASAAICSMMVLDPWPLSTAPENSVMRPARVTPVTIPDGLDMPVLPMPYHMQATPAPRRRWIGCPSRSRQSGRCVGETPACRGQDVWRACPSAPPRRSPPVARPKPRNAPEGGPLVWIAAVVQCTFATAYGPAACAGTRLATIGPKLA